MTRPFSELNYTEMTAQMDKTGTVDMSKLTPPKPKRLKNNNEESRSQKALIKWWSHRCKDFDIPEQLLFSIPNGMAFGGKAEWQVKTSIIRGKNAKLEGLRPGIPDLFLAVPKQVLLPGDPSIGYYQVFNASGCFVEMKTSFGVVQPEQKMIHAMLKARGYAVRICRSTEEAIKTIEEYLA